MTILLEYLYICHEKIIGYSSQANIFPKSHLSIFSRIVFCFAMNYSNTAVMHAQKLEIHQKNIFVIMNEDRLWAK